MYSAVLPEKADQATSTWKRVLASCEDDRHMRRLSDVDLNKLYGDIEDADDNDDPIETVRPADPELRALIVNFFKTFKQANMRDSVFGLDIAGMIDHTEGEYKGHCSILYKLPSTIGLQSRERPAENLKLRAPMTLQSLLGNRYKRGVRSTLGARYKLARKLVRAVCLLHSSGWLHKNIRAGSVIFFPEHVALLQEDRYEIDIEIDVSKPILMGYIFSRSDDIIQMNPPPSPMSQADRHDRQDTRGAGAYFSTRVWEVPVDAPAKDWAQPSRNSSIYGHNPSNQIGELQETKKTNISGFTLDYYQHPAKHASPTRLYRHAYDVYSLGILLLEIGLWMQLHSYEYANCDLDREDHYERRRWICREYLADLRWTCGDTYADVVLSCLMIDCSDDEAAKASERELCARIVADLEGCRA